MQRLTHIVFSSLVFAAVLAAAGAPAWAQAPDPFEQELARDRGRELDADETGVNGLRGRLDPDGEGAGARRRGAERDAGDTLTAETPDPLAPETVRQVDQVLLPSGADLAADDPYAAIGVRLGSFLLFPTLAAETIYSDNIFLSGTNTEGDWALALTPRLDLRSDWSRHSFTANVGGERSFHERFASEDDKTFEAGLSGRLDVRSTTNLVAEANYARFLEDRSSTDFPANASERPRARNSDASLEANHSFNRVTLTLRGDLLQQDFDDSLLDDGTIENNDDRDYTERRLTGRAAYEFQPGVAAFVEASVNERDFSQAIDDNGTRNGSSGHDVQAGLSFRLSGKLTGEASAGYALQTPVDTTLEDVDGLIFNAGLVWEATGLTTVRLDAASTVAETTQAGTAGSIVRSAKVSLEHRPRRHIVLGTSLGYEREAFSGSGEVDEEWLAGLTGEYLFTPSLALTMGYRHLISTSSTPGSDYNVDEVRMGVRLRR